MNDLIAGLFRERFEKMVACICCYSSKASIFDGEPDKKALAVLVVVGGGAE